MLQDRGTNDERFSLKLVSTRCRKSILKWSKHIGNQLKYQQSVLMDESTTHQNERLVTKKCVQSVKWALPLVIKEEDGAKCTEDDLVQLSNDIELVRQLQCGHGEWSDAMRPALGLIGKVVKVFPNHDVKVEVCGTVWTFHPSVIVSVIDPIRDKKFPILKELNEEFVRTASDGNLDKCEYILKQFLIDVNCLYAGQAALHKACRNGHLNVISLLVKANADIELEDQDGNRAIHHAASGKKPLEVVEFLYDLSIRQLEINSRNKKRQSALHLAVNNDSLTLVRLLIKLGANVNLQDMEGDTAIHDAISKNNEPITTLLLSANAHLHICNNFGFNIIQHATLRGSVEIVRSLLNHTKQTKTDWLLNEKKDDGYTALHLACLNNYVETVRLFMDSCHLDANVKNLVEKTPLHLAVDKMNHEVIKVLLDYKPHQTFIDVNIQDKDGNTPLHILIRNYSTSIQASRRTEDKSNRPIDQTNPVEERQSNEQVENDLHIKMARLLIDHGASLTLRNKQLQTPLDLCSEATTVTLLNKYHSDVIQYQIMRPKTESEQANGLSKMCKICSKNVRNVLFKPCKHVVACHECSQKCVKCPICEETIENSERIEECMVCGDKQSSVLVEPCGHVTTCDSCSMLTKKCIKCRVHIDDKLILSDLCAKNCYKSSISIGSNGITTSIKTINDAGQLVQQLQTIKEQTMCSICCDKIKNMVFMCGHSTCQMCGDKINVCPICRKFIKRRIIIY